MNTPVAISELITFFKKIYPYLKEGLPVEFREKVWNSLKKFNQIFKILKFPQKVEDREILQKIELRQKARSEGNYELADKIRDELERQGYWVFDLPSGTKVIALKEKL